MDELKLLLEAVNALGSTGLLVVFVVFFIRGDIIGRKTMNEIIERLMSEISVKYTAAVDDILERRINELREEIRTVRRGSGGPF